MATISKIKKMKIDGDIYSATVLYDYSFAKTAIEAGIDVIVVGDSVCMSMFGEKTTVPTTMDMMVYHTKAVSNAADKTLIIADLPYGAYISPNQAMENSVKLMKAGASMIKLEGEEKWTIDTVKYLTERGIPVCAHIGLTPQYFHQLGGYKTAGKTDDEQERIFNVAVDLDQAGAEMIVLECIPEHLGNKITKEVKASTMGAGAGRNCDGQVLLMYDLIGLTGGHIKFSKNFLAESDSISNAIKKFSEDVKTRKFPTKDNIY